MNDAALQHLLSLSALSLLGPKWDVDYLNETGFYKKGNTDAAFVLNIGLDADGFGLYDSLVRTFLKALDIKNQSDYTERLNSLISGTLFSQHMDQMLQLGRSMNRLQRNKLGSLRIEGHPYMHDLFEEVMTYEFHWPEAGMKSYDIANAVMLLRLGRCLGYLDETKQSSALEWLAMETESVFADYESFGQAAVIGRNIHLKHLSVIGVDVEAIDTQWVLSMAYHSLWVPLKLVEE